MKKLLNTLAAIPGKLFVWIRTNRVFRAIYRALNIAPLYHWGLAFLGSIFYPVDKKLILVGVTGTKGKTTTLELLNTVLEANGAKTALLSSVRMKIADTTAKNMTGNSMPGRFYIQKFLRRAAAAGCTHALIEVTSEGIKLSRDRFIPWRVALLTNLSAEHIESHGSFEKYRDAKGSFLAYALRHGAAVFLNRDDAENTGFYANMLRQVRANPDITLFSGVDVAWVDDLPSSASDPHTFVLKFNKENAAAARAIALRLDVPEAAIRPALESFAGVPGRTEFVQTTPFAAVVDYAHTPDSLMKAYDALRTSPYRAPTGRLICVLGSAGGGRDKWKRPLMGRIAAEYCDEIILTNEDPFDEDPETILKEIAAGFTTAQNQRFASPDSYRVIIDRQEALDAAVRDAKPGDVVIATGKGSESTIRLARGATIPWNEREAMQRAIGSIKK